MDDKQVEAEVKILELECELRQIKSMSDHTFNIVLNAPEYCLEQTQVLMGWLNDLVKITVINE